MVQKTLLTDSEWQIIEKHIPNNTRKRKYPLRIIVEAIFYIVRTGCQWRNLPATYPPWESVYYYFSEWRDKDIFEHINDMLREQVRKCTGRNASCSTVIIDSQSVKTTRRGGLRGIDGNKKIKGRKRHIAVDTQGNVVSCLVHPANIHDANGGKLLMRQVHENIHGIKVVFADNAYRKSFKEYVTKTFGYRVEITPRIADVAKNGVSPKRWVVERTIAWMESFRRIAKDYEYLLESSQAMVYLMSISLLVNKLSNS